uniref:Uncharacterized protein n=1 Tax=Phaeomonas parva TaxID=124430 RepID=A0A7S1U1I9_9STRA|mmetsp:Transcript_26803/g.83988  ORF Transcript_26803/g.83988 Transcript_26803/m.83988 type:complete len:286 (+) Transcript_26803:496-1353(+)
MWGVASLPKRQALEMLERESKDYPNIFRTLAAAMKETCGGAGFLACALEDDYRGAEEGKVKIGGAVIIARDARFGGAAATGLGSTRLVECYADEAIALAQGLGLQLTCETELFDGACVPVASATFDGKGVAITVNEAKLPEASEADGKPNLPPHKASLHPAWEVKHADDYFKLTLAEKRALLARSGADVPRRGRGEAALDSALLPLLDENVRRDVQLMKALRAGDMERVSELSQNRSERHPTTRAPTTPLTLILTSALTPTLTLTPTGGRSRCSWSRPSLTRTTP